MQDKDGTGRNLNQYSYITLKKDALRWLRKNGRLPSFTTGEYFKEVKFMQKQKEENKGLKEENQTLREES